MCYCEIETRTQRVVIELRTVGQLVVAVRSRPKYLPVATANNRPPVAPRSHLPVNVRTTGGDKTKTVDIMLTMIAEEFVESGLSLRPGERFLRCPLVAQWLENIGRCVSEINIKVRVGREVRVKVLDHLKLIEVCRSFSVSQASFRSERWRHE